MEVPEILAKAATALDVKGWRRSTTANSRFTVGEAIDMVIDPWLRANDKAKNALLDHFDIDDVVTLNDRFRSKDEAVSALLMAVLALSGPTRHRKTGKPRGRAVKGRFAPLVSVVDLPLHASHRLPVGSHWACQADDPAYTPEAHFDWRCPDCVGRAEAFIEAGPVPVQQWVAAPGAKRRIVPLRYLVERSRSFGV